MDEDEDGLVEEDAEYGCKMDAGGLTDEAGLSLVLVGVELEGV